EYLTFSSGEQVQARASSSRVLVRGSLPSVAVQRAANCLEQRIPGYGLFKKVHSAALHRPHTGGHIRVTGQKYHGQSNPMTSHGGLQIETRWTWQVHIEQQATRFVGGRL